MPDGLRKDKLRKDGLEKDGLGKVDHSAHRVNQGAIIVLLLISFIINVPWLAAAVAAFMLAGAAVGRPGFLFLYARLLRPAGIVRPNVIPDNAEPRGFAQGFGGAVAAVSAAATLLGAPVLGWTLAWLVIILAALNLFAGFCVGCAVYYWLHRLQTAGGQPRICIRGQAAEPVAEDERRSLRACASPAGLAIGRLNSIRRP